jgi:hypothetical protein
MPLLASVTRAGGPALNRQALRRRAIGPRVSRWKQKAEGVRLRVSPASKRSLAGMYDSEEADEGTRTLDFCMATRRHASMLVQQAHG